MSRIEIYDTTLRDGSQGEGINFSLQDKLLIAQRLDSLGFDFIEGGYPLSNEKDAQFFQRVQRTAAEARARLRLRHDAPQGREGRRRPRHAGAAGFRRADDHDRRQDVGSFTSTEVLRVVAGRKPGDDRATRVGYPAWPRAAR